MEGARIEDVIRTLINSHNSGLGIFFGEWPDYSLATDCLLLNITGGLTREKRMDGFSYKKDDLQVFHIQLQLRYHDYDEGRALLYKISKELGSYSHYPFNYNVYPYGGNEEGVIENITVLDEAVYLGKDVKGLMMWAQNFEVIVR